MNDTPSRPKTLLVGLGMGLLLGGALTAFAMKQESRPVAEARADATPTEQATSAVTRSVAARSTPRDVRAPSATNRTQATPARAEQNQGGADSRPPPAPANLEERFTSPALQKAFEVGMKEVGIDGVVLDVDCAEYPCVVYAQGNGRDDVEKILNSESLRTYAGDSKTSGMRIVKDPQDPSKERVFFSVSVRRKADQLERAQLDHLQQRARLGLETFQSRPDE